MLKAWTLLSFGALAPVLFLLILQKRLRRAEIFVGLGLNLAYQAILAAYLHMRVPYGWLKILLVVTCSIILTHLTLRVSFKRDQIPLRIWVIGFSILGCFCCFDSFLILARQGWEPLLGSGPYFRAPFNNDGERTVILVEALIRGKENPFLVGTPLNYQSLWYHWAALYLAVLPSLHRASAVAGALWSTSVLGSLLILWSFTRVSPRMFFRPWGWIMAGILFLSADSYHFMESLVLGGQAGIEADWSWPPVFIHFFPLKMAALTAPQHFLFLIFLSVFLVVPEFLSYFFYAAAWIASPPLSIFFFPFYFLARRKNAAKFFLVTLVAFLVHQLALGFPPWVLFIRKGIQSPTFWDVSWWAWPLLPVMGALITGVLGIFIFIFIASLWKKFRLDLFRGWEMLVLSLGVALSHYTWTNYELRRHFALVAFLAAAFWICRYFTALSPGKRKALALTAVGPALFLHGYFLYSFMGKPNQLDVSFPWKDYLAMNEILRHEFPGMPVLAGAHPHAIGTICPPAQEATTSFNTPLSAAVHTRLPEELMPTLGKMFIGGDFAPYGGRLGYRAILWGPVEERVWGEKTRRRFIDERGLLARSGTVGLYWLHDSWTPEIRKERGLGGDYEYRIAHRFAVDNWRSEAVEFYREAVQKNPNHRQAWMEMARVIESMGQADWGKKVLRDAIATVPNFKEAQDQLGTLDAQNIASGSTPR